MHAVRGSVYSTKSNKQKPRLFSSCIAAIIASPNITKKVANVILV